MLRTDSFKTVDRVETRFIAIRDTLTQPDLDIKELDVIHCKQGRLGVGWHFVVLGTGTIQLGRDIETCGSHSKGLDALSVAIGVTGGIDEAGDRTLTRTTEQWQAIDDLVRFLQDRYPANHLRQPNPRLPDTLDLTPKRSGGKTHG